MRLYEKIRSLEDAYKELHVVADKLKEYKKIYKIPGRSRDRVILHRILNNHHKNRFGKRIKYSGRYYCSEEDLVFNLLLQKSWLIGFIVAFKLKGLNSDEEE